MIQRPNEQELIQPKMAILIEATRQPLKSVEQFELFKNILQYIKSNHTNHEEHHQMLLKMLTSVENQRIFNALLSYLLGNLQNKGLSMGKEPFASLLNYMDSSGKYQKNIINAFLSDSCSNSSYLEMLVDSCRSSKSRSQIVLKRINQILVQKMNQSPIAHINFTYTSLFALKCIQYCETASSTLIQEAIRHLLIVDSIQKGQIQKIILENQSILQKIELLGQREYVPGSWYYLVAKMQSNEHPSERIIKIAQNTYQKILLFINLNKNLNEQIDKIMYSSYNQIKKLNLIHQLRGLTFFMSSFAKYLIKSNQITNEVIAIIEKLMQIKDFQCFQQLIKVYFEFISHNLVSTQFSPSIIAVIQENCLPISNEPQSRLSPYDAGELQFYAFRFEDKNQINISAQSSLAMDKIVEIMMDSRGCKHKQKICNCCEEYIHTTIQKQYDHEFNSHQFMSACHLMCREISRVIKINPEQTEVENLKNYLITNLKWLLNLNESCLPEHRKCINFKIFDLMISFPPLFEKNQFLKQVVEDLLVSRLPQSINHLIRLLRFYKSKCHSNSEATMIDESSQNDLEKIGQKIIKKCDEDCLKLEDKIKLWDSMITIWEKNEIKSMQLMQTYSQSEDHNVAKYTVCKKKKLKLSEKIEAKAIETRQKMSENIHFYSEDIISMQNYEKND